MYVKLFGSILDSSIWSESYPTRLVWITMLAMADAGGVVSASVSGVARRAAVTRKETARALRLLCAPDRDRPNQEYEGRRLKTIDGGWVVLNYEKYREIRTQQQFRDALRQRKHREKSKPSRDGSRTSRDPSQPSRDRSQQAEAEAEAEKRPWVVTLGEAWQQTYGGQPPYGRIGRACKLLVDTEGLPRVLEYWSRYLQHTPARYASPHRFAETFGSWANGAGAAQDGPVSEDDAATAFRKAGIDLSQTRVKPGGYASRAELERAIIARTGG